MWIVGGVVCGPCVDVNGGLHWYGPRRAARGSSRTPQSDQYVSGHQATNSIPDCCSGTGEIKQTCTHAGLISCLTSTAYLSARLSLSLYIIDLPAAHPM